MATTASRSRQLWHVIDAKNRITGRLAVHVARLLMGIKDYEHAVELFAKSNEFCGTHHVTCHNMGICEFYSGQLSRAMNATTLVSSSLRICSAAGHSS